MFGSDVQAAAQRHALAEYPREAVGFVIAGAYAPQVNVAADPGNQFCVAPEAWDDDVQAVIHSHTLTYGLPADRDARAPSAADMQAQLAAAVPFGIVATDGEIATDILWWGDHLLDEPLIGRRFVPGVLDCYELVRAWCWQERAIRLPSFPRDAEWWEHGQDMLAQGFSSAGFVRVAIEDAQRGDSFLIALPAHGVVNHCGVLLEGGLMLHHRAGQLSRREPWSGAWRRLTRLVVRHR